MISLEEDYMRSIESELLEDVRNNPEDDTPRLVLSDWYMDHDEELLGSFIRWQIQGTDSVDLEEYGKRIYWSNPHSLWALKDSFSGRFTKITTEGRSVTFSTEGNVHITYRRGFVDELKVPLSTWLENGSWLIDTYQLSRVGLSERRPEVKFARGGFPFKKIYYWNSEFGGLHSILTLEIFKYLSGGIGRSDAEVRYDSVQDALDSLSDAMFVYARNERAKKSAQENLRTHYRL